MDASKWCRVYRCRSIGYVIENCIPNRQKRQGGGLTETESSEGVKKAERKDEARTDTRSETRSGSERKKGKSSGGGERGRIGNV